LSRVVSNVLVSPADDGLIAVRSVCNITAFRRGHIDIFSGRVVHRLRPAQDSFRIAAKTVYLVNNDGVIRNLTFLV
jgi:3-phenylpropionate/cinnamic acid dioxygenase small subunit